MNFSETIDHLQGIGGKHGAVDITTPSGEYTGILAGENPNVAAALAKLDIVVGNLSDRTKFKAVGSEYSPTAADIHAFGGLVVSTGVADIYTLPTSGFADPAGKRFTVINNTTSTENLTVNGKIVEPGSGVTFSWDGAAWKPTDDSKNSDEIVNKSEIAGSSVTDALDAANDIITDHESRLDNIEPVVADQGSRLSVAESIISDHEGRLDVVEADKAEDAEVVHNTGDETIAGEKTFSTSPIVPTPTADMQAATKKYVDDTSGGMSRVSVPSGDTRILIDASNAAKVAEADHAAEADTCPNIHKIGDIKIKRYYEPISPTNPWFCLNSPSTSLEEYYFPDYVPWLRDQVTGIGVSGFSPQTVFPGIIYDRDYPEFKLDASNNLTQLLNALFEWKLKNGVWGQRVHIYNVTRDQSIYGALDISSIVSRAVEIDVALPMSWLNNDVIQLSVRPHIRYDVLGNLVTDEVNHWQITGDALMAADDPDGRFLGGMGRRSRLWAHWHYFANYDGTVTWRISGSTGGSNRRLSYTLDCPYSGTLYASTAKTDTVHGVPLLDSINTPPATGVYIYEYVGRYIA